MTLLENVGSRLSGLHSKWSVVGGAALLMRGVLGYVFVAHGAQKLFGWFGGRGIEGTAGFFDFLGIPAPRFFAVPATRAANSPFAVSIDHRAIKLRGIHPHGSVGARRAPVHKIPPVMFVPGTTNL